MSPTKENDQHLDLSVALEELSTAEEELRAQNEQLASAQLIINAERQRYQELFNLAPDGYLVTDSAGVIQEANLAASNMMGRPRRYLSGKPVRALIHADDRGRLDSLLDRIHSGASVAAGELRLERQGQPPVPAEGVVNATLGPIPRSTSLRWLVRDLTERKAAEERVNRADRLAAIGHESRRFLQRIQSCLRLLRLEVDGNPSCIDLLDRASRGVDDVARLFDDLREGISRPRLRYGPCNRDRSGGAPGTR
jgi:PAS domain S-box-containing protein